MTDEIAWRDGLRDIFGAKHVTSTKAELTVDGVRYPIIDGVIVLLPPDEYPRSLRSRLSGPGVASASVMATDIQESFGLEWQEFSEILPEHRREFNEYFDLVDLEGLKGARVCDLGSGTGRWAYFLAGRCRQLVLVDFSDAIFVARQNLSEVQNAYFFLGDLTRLPFRDDFADLIYSLGVLHHLPINALDALVALRRFAPTILVYLYYSLDNRAAHFRVAFRFVDWIRRQTSRVTSPLGRSVLTWMLWAVAYLPMIAFGRAAAAFGLADQVPLYQTYYGKSIRRVRQDVYDRFFTSIEQRFSRAEILALNGAFRSVTVSDTPPYWHFTCDR